MIFDCNRENDINIDNFDYNLIGIIWLFEE